MALAATTLSGSALILSSLIVWFVALYVYGLEEAAPFHLGSCLAALSGLWVIGFGAGLYASAIGRFGTVIIPLWPRLWRRIWRRFVRLLIFVSGIFFIADLLPLTWRNIIVWNPLVHGIEWFRWGLYGNYPIMTLEIDYFLKFAAGILFVGVVVFWSTIRFASR